MTVDMRIEETFNSPWLGEWDLPDDGKDVKVTIKDVELETVHNGKANQDKDEVILYFEGPLKPMILSARCNKDAIKEALGTGHTKEWVGKTIQLYREEGNWFGKHGFAVRIRPFVSK